jgi:RHS repeat-associated protein
MSVTQTYTYNCLNQLTGASESGVGWSQAYQFTNGNLYIPQANSSIQLSLETPQASSWYASSNRINGWAYDNNGNILGVGSMSRAFTYDAENRQVNATINSNGASYVYDGLGQRVQKTVNGVTATFVYDAFGNLASEYGPAEASPCGSNTPCYVSVDHLGSTRLLMDSTGAVQRRYDYLPFGGELLASTGSRTTGMGYVSAPDDVGPKFTSQTREPETAMDWFNVRDYDPAQGRFQSVDPGNAGADPSDPQTWNMYAYVGNNPLSYTDPSGMFISATAIGAETAGPWGAVVGAAIDLGADSTATRIRICGVI